jgi:nitronate monooxygenase
MLRTRLCDRLGIDVPVIAAPMGAAIAGPELAAAVSNAGGLGIMSFGGYPPPLLRQRIRRLRELTERPFGVNVLLSGVRLPCTQDDVVAVCIEERIPVLSFFWGDPSPYVARAHAAGIAILHQVGSVAAAVDAVRSGVDVVIAQGVEAGGHVAGRVATMVLVPRVVDAIAPVPVVAAGGIGDARGLAAALALGADGAVLGTRFIATPEAGAHPAYKQHVLRASEEDTVRTSLFGGGFPHAPHRALRTRFVEEWLADEARGSEERPDEPILGETEFAGMRIPVPRFAALPPGAGATGEIDSMAMLAGQTVGLVHEIKPAAEIVRELVEGARRIIDGLNGACTS